MIKRNNYPRRKFWERLAARPKQDYTDIAALVSEIMERVRKEGDVALRQFAQTFDGVNLNDLKVSAEEWENAAQIAPELKAAIQQAADNIRTFHAAYADKQELLVETMPGIVCWQKNLPIQRVGLYVPGGTAPLCSTLMMLAIPALLAGCSEIIVCTPPDKNGSVNPAILFVAQLLGLNTIFKAGGTQAIAAMAYGTETIPAVDKIFGPGNRYVTAAKLQLAGAGFAIDMPAAPSELAILADESCVPEFVAADLLSQAEHDTESQVMLVSNSPDVLDAVNRCLEEQLQILPRRDIAATALSNSHLMLMNSLEEGLEFLNVYAPEHLIIACNYAKELAEKVINAGSVFLGNYSPESGGDYATGPNHTLPTGGAARAFSGISVSSFQKKISFQELSMPGLESIADTVTQLARAEGLEAHARAVEIRFNKNQ